MSDNDSMTALMEKIKIKAVEEKKNADRKPASVEEAQAMVLSLEERKNSLQKHMKILETIGGDPELTKMMNQAFSSISQGLNRSKTVIEASRILPQRRRKVIQVCFLFDATASMTCGDIINNVKTSI